MKHFMTAAALLIGLMVGYVPLQAQNCFRGQPLPECKSFWITEFGWGIRVGSGFEGSYLTSEIGKMFNLKRNNHYALGATALVGYTPLEDRDRNIYEIRFGIKPRVRRWLNSTMSIDLSAGIILLRRGEANLKNTSFTGHLGLNFKDWFILAAQLETSSYTDQKSQLNWYLGLKTGSTFGIISTGLFGALAIYARSWEQD
jgi:hypothetical protein